MSKVSKLEKRNEHQFEAQTKFLIIFYCWIVVLGDFYLDVSQMNVRFSLNFLKDDPQILNFFRIRRPTPILANYIRH